MTGNIDIDTIPLDDKKTYELFKRETVGIFSMNLDKTFKISRPTAFSDLIAMNALYRPDQLNIFQVSKKTW